MYIYTYVCKSINQYNINQYINMYIYTPASKSQVGKVCHPKVSHGAN